MDFVMFCCESVQVEFIHIHYGLVLLWHKTNGGIVPVSMRGPWEIGVNESRESAMNAGSILLFPANERRRYIVTSSLIGLAHTQNDP